MDTEPISDARLEEILKRSGTPPTQDEARQLAIEVATVRGVRLAAAKVIEAGKKLFRR